MALLNVLARGQKGLVGILARLFAVERTFFYRHEVVFRTQTYGLALIFLRHSLKGRSRLVFRRIAMGCTVFQIGRLGIGVADYSGQLGIDRVALIALHIVAVGRQDRPQAVFIVRFDVFGQHPAHVVGSGPVAIELLVARSLEDIGIFPDPFPSGASGGVVATHPREGDDRLVEGLDILGIFALKGAALLPVACRNGVDVMFPSFEEIPWETLFLGLGDNFFKGCGLCLGPVLCHGIGKGFPLLCEHMAAIVGFERFTGHRSYKSIHGKCGGRKGSHDRDKGQNPFHNHLLLRYFPSRKRGIASATAKVLPPI